MNSKYGYNGMRSFSAHFKCFQESRQVERTEKMITFENVTKSYGNGAPALSNLNIEIEDGEFVFVVGTSG